LTIQAQPWRWVTAAAVAGAMAGGLCADAMTLVDAKPSFTSTTVEQVQIVNGLGAYNLNSYVQRVEAARLASYGADPSVLSLAAKAVEPSPPVAALEAATHSAELGETNRAMFAVTWGSPTVSQSLSLAVASIAAAKERASAPKPVVVSVVSPAVLPRQADSPDLGDPLARGALLGATVAVALLLLIPVLRASAARWPRRLRPGG
jgi:hypothetical protein